MNYENYAGLKNWSADQFGRPDKGEELFYEFEVGNRLRRSDPKNISILEIGFGNGTFLGWARSKNYRVTGLELQSTLRRRAEEAGFPVIDSVESLADESQDIVVVFDVFEHVPYADLLELCRQISRVLKPTGFLVARFPNGDSPFSLPIQNGDPTHVHALGRGTISQLMATSGMSILELRAPNAALVSVKSKLLYPIKQLLRESFRQLVKLAYLGGSTPSTFGINYLLVAAPSRVQRVA